MSLKRIFLIGMVVLAITSTPATAAEADQCKDILAEGAFDTQVSEGSHYEYVATSKLACSESAARIYATALLENGTPINIGMDRHKHQCDSIAKTRVIDSNHFAFLKTASAAIVKAWSTCMQNKSFNEPVRFGVRQRADLRTIIFSVQYQSPGGYSQNVPGLRASMEFSDNDLVPGSCTCINKDPKICNTSGTSVKVSVAHGDQVEFECGRENKNDIKLTLRTRKDGIREVKLAALDLKPRLFATSEALPAACRQGGAINSWIGGNRISKVELWNYDGSAPVLKVRSDRGFGFDQKLDLVRNNLSVDVQKNYPKKGPAKIAFVTHPASRQNGLSITLMIDSEIIEHRLLSAGGNWDCYQENNLSVRILDRVQVDVSRKNWVCLVSCGGQQS